MDTPKKSARVTITFEGMFLPSFSYSDIVDAEIFISPNSFCLRPRSSRRSLILSLSVILYFIGVPFCRSGCYFYTGLDRSDLRIFYHHNYEISISDFSKKFTKIRKSLNFKFRRFFMIRYHQIRRWTGICLWFILCEKGYVCLAFLFYRKSL